MDYEEVIHLLEAEIAELKTQRAEQPSANKVTPAMCFFYFVLIINYISCFLADFLWPRTP